MPDRSKLEMDVLHVLNPQKAKKKKQIGAHFNPESGSNAHKNCQWTLKKEVT